MSKAWKSVSRLWSKPSPTAKDRPDAATEAITDQRSTVTLADYPIFPPPAPREILADRAKFTSNVRGRRFAAPKGYYTDTPLFSLYRYYEFVVLDYVTGYRNQEEYFWKQRSWAVCDIPDPHDLDTERYAFLAGCTYLLVRAFNARIKIGLTRDVPAIMTEEEHEHFRNLAESEKTYEKVPTWAEEAPPLSELLTVATNEGEILHGREDDRADSDFLRKNILLWTPHIHFT